jgi:hypothetical protein
LILCFISIFPVSKLKEFLYKSALNVPSQF